MSGLFSGMLDDIEEKAPTLSVPTVRAKVGHEGQQGMVKEVSDRADLA